MSAWNFDISSAPRNAKLWLAAVDGLVVGPTSWDKKRGQWAGFATNGTPPIAWQPYVVPEHPNSPKKAIETMGGTGDDCSFGKSGEWPPQGGASGSRGNDSLRVVTGGESAASQFILDDCGSGA